MYPYFYPSYFSPTKMGPSGMNPAGMGGTGMGPGGMGGPGAGPMGMGNAGMGASMPDMTELPPVPGTTAGVPVTPVAPVPPTIQPPPVDFDQEPGPPVTSDIGYTQAYLKTQIGKRVKIEFLIGTNMLTDRIGTIVGVGVSYILLRLTETDDIMMGDIYAIKFVTFYE